MKSHTQALGLSFALYGPQQSHKFTIHAHTTVWTEDVESPKPLNQLRVDI